MRAKAPWWCSIRSAGLRRWSAGAPTRQPVRPRAESRCASQARPSSPSSISPRSRAAIRRTRWPMTGRPPSTAGRRRTTPAPIAARSRSARRLAQSINTVAASLGGGGRRAGAWCVTARRLGIQSELHDNPSIALGTAEVSLLELTAAYVPFANGGQGVMPHIIAARAQRRRQGALSSGSVRRIGQVVALPYVAAMNDMMNATVDARHRKAGGARRVKSPAGKTGTTQNSRDAWFVGYTAHYVGGRVDRQRRRLAHDAK